MDKIVLLAKQPGVTSFTSLYNVKRAFNTTKVGHTGTLDNFAQGLLVVCTGRLTRLAGNITEFDKSYKAVIRFGSETDTLDYEGNIIRESDLPDEETVHRVIISFTGEQLQTPPSFSAIHVDGKRASELVRKGVEVEIPARKITVYDAKILDLKKNENNKVTECLVDFSVSKGTYVRCLARDIGKACDSAAHLIGLYRTRVGEFDVTKAAGFNMLPDFNIENCIKICEKFKTEGRQKSDRENDLIFQKEIFETSQDLDEKTAALCGFEILHLKDEQSEKDFCFGRPLHKTFFSESIHINKEEDLFAVFGVSGNFCGLVGCKNLEKQYVGYKMVIQ